MHWHGGIFYLMTSSLLPRSANISSHDYQYLYKF